MVESSENEVLKNTGTWLSDISVAIIQAGVALLILNPRGFHTKGFFVASSPQKPFINPILAPDTARPFC